MSVMIIGDDFENGPWRKVVPSKRPVMKHGDHDQSSHGNWSTARGGKPDEYRRVHRAPDREFGAPMHDVTQGIYPEDIYGSNGSRYYGTGNSRADAESFAAIRRLRGKPDGKVTVYRAVPKGVKRINPGDWVTPSLTYAMEHGEGPLGGDFEIASAETRASDVFTNGDSINEWGFDPAGGSSLSAVIFPKYYRKP